MLTRWSCPQWSNLAMPRWSSSRKKQEPGRVAADSAGPVAASPGLLRLPRELRDMIYEYTNLLPRKQLLRTVLSAPNRTEKLWTCEACESPAFDCYCYRPPLFLVCGQIRDEALDFVFARNLFQLPAEERQMVQYECSPTRDLLSLAQVHRNIRGPVRPPKDLLALWTAFLGRIRYLCLTINKDLLDRPAVVSSALRNAPRLTEIVLSKGHREHNTRVPAEFFVELAKIPSLTLITLANGFGQGDDCFASEITGLPARLTCWCNYGQPWGPTPCTPPGSFSIGCISFAMLGCYVTDNLDGPTTQWHVPSVDQRYTRNWGRCNPGEEDPWNSMVSTFRWLPITCCSTKDNGKEVAHQHVD